MMCTSTMNMYLHGTLRTLTSHISRLHTPPLGCLSRWIPWGQVLYTSLWWAYTLGPWGYANDKRNNLPRMWILWICASERKWGMQMWPGQGWQTQEAQSTIVDIVTNGVYIHCIWCLTSSQPFAWDPRREHSKSSCNCLATVDGLTLPLITYSWRCSLLSCSTLQFWSHQCQHSCVYSSNMNDLSSCCWRCGHAVTILVLALLG